MKKIFAFITILLISLTFYAQTLNEQLIEACYNNDEKVVFDLLRLGANPNAQTIFGTTPLMYAVQNGNYIVCQKLLEVGADINLSSKKALNPLINAVINKDTAITLLLLEHNANPNATDTLNKKTALLYAIDNQNELITDLLLYFGANPNKQADTIPLIYCIKTSGDTAIFNTLLKYKAKTNIYDADGYTPLIYSVFYNYPQITKLLIQNKANPSLIAKKEKLTPLFFAIKFRLKEVTKVLAPLNTTSIRDNHNEAISNDFAYGAKLIRQSSKKHFLLPYFSHFLINTSLLMIYNDAFWNLSVGIHESRYNLDFSVGVQPRIFSKRVSLPLNQNTFLQLWEHRTIIKPYITKYFVLLNTDKTVNGIFISTAANFSYGTYNGTTRQITKQLVPSVDIGWWWRYKFIKYSVGYEYLPIETNFPHFVTFNLMFLINLNQNKNH